MHRIISLFVDVNQNYKRTPHRYIDLLYLLSCSEPSIATLTLLVYLLTCACLQVSPRKARSGRSTIADSPRKARIPLHDNAHLTLLSLSLCCLLLHILRIPTAPLPLPHLPSLSFVCCVSTVSHPPSPVPFFTPFIASSSSFDSSLLTVFHLNF